MVVDSAEHDMAVRMRLVEMSDDYIRGVNDTHTLHIFSGNLNHKGIIEPVGILRIEVERDMPDGIFHSRIEGAVILERADYLLAVFLSAYAAGINKPPFIAGRTVGTVLFLAGHIFDAATESAPFCYLPEHGSPSSVTVVFYQISYEPDAFQCYSHAVYELLTVRLAVHFHKIIDEFDGTVQIVFYSLKVAYSL